jgi:polyhydroxyalkanoate synthesis regulator phasin
MLDVLKKGMLKGIGMGLLAKEELDDLASELTSKSKMTEQEGQKFVDELRLKYEDAQQRLEKRVEDTVRKILKKANLVSADEVAALQKEIQSLKKSLNKLKTD